MIRALVLGCVLVSAVIAGEEPTPPAPPASVPASPAVVLPPVPPSPSTAPGIRIWPDPRFTVWPPIVYRDEPRNVAFALPVKKPGAAGTIAWDGQTPLPITLPTDAESIGGLLPLPANIGEHRAIVAIESGSFPIVLRICDARETWPITGLSNGFPVDADGRAVVLQDRRRGTREERVWSFLDAGEVRPSGRALLIGDALEALGARVWDGLDADARPAIDERYPHHAVLVGLAAILAEGTGEARQRLPRTIVWSPGNQTLHGGAWTAEEERVLGLVRTRCERLGVMPRLVLALPPLPVEAHLQARATERRELLLRSANRLGWVVVDLARAAGAPEEANRVAPQVFTTYPLAAAQERMRAALREALAR
ncbi:MAG: hypothetical protein H0W78_20150 [Planctomycetes bacterium]|nr:hypothetical protein [Planctomycetota bacterium]